MSSNILRGFRNYSYRCLNNSTALTSKLRMSCPQLKLKSNASLLDNN